MLFRNSGELIGADLVKLWHGQNCCNHGFLKWPLRGIIKALGDWRKREKKWVKTLQRRGSEFNFYARKRTSLPQTAFISYRIWYSWKDKRGFWVLWIVFSAILNSCLFSRIKLCVCLFKLNRLTNPFKATELLIAFNLWKKRCFIYGKSILIRERKHCCFA